MEMIQIYKKRDPDELIHTSKGPTVYYDFLCQEKFRLEQLGRTAEIKGGEPLRGGRHTEICLLVNKLFYSCQTIPLN